MSDLFAMPDHGRIVQELKEQGIYIYREMIITPGRAVYRISDWTVFILSVTDIRRNVEDILLDKLIKKADSG